MRSAGLTFASFSLAVLFAAPALGQADTTPPTVTGVTADGTALPGAVLTSAPGSIMVTFSEEIDASTLTTDSVRLVRSGGDRTFWDGNEVEIVPTSVTLDRTGTQATMELAGVTTPNDDYQVTVSGGGPTTGLVAHWKLDEGSGQTVADHSLSGFDGVLGAGAGADGNDPVWATGPNGAAVLDFDGIDDRVDCGDILNTLTVPFSVAAWVNLDSVSASGTYLMRSDIYGTTHSGFQLTISGAGTPGIQYGDATGGGPSDRRSMNGLVPAPLGGWIHLAAVVRGPTDMTLYMDGVDIGGTYSGTGGDIGYTTNPCWLGAGESSGNATLAGLLCDVRVYDRALVQAEVDHLVAGAVTDLAGNPLDGEHSSSLPSGDGTPGGDFVCTFTIENVTPPAPVTDLSLSAGDESVTVAWRNPFDTDFAGVVVLRRVDADPTGTPTDGVTYDVGNALGDGFVVYVGTGTAGIPGDRSSWENTGLLNDTDYHYSIFAYDEAMNYSPGVTASAVAGASGGGDGGLCTARDRATPLARLALFSLFALIVLARSRRAARAPE